MVWTTGGADIASGAQVLSRLLGTLGGVQLKAGQKEVCGERG